MENVTVVGGSGFLGQEVSKELLDKKYKVKIFDKNQPNLIHKNLKYVRGNILILKNLRRQYKVVLMFIILQVLLT